MKKSNDVELPLETKLELDKFELTIKEINVRSGKQIIDVSYLYVEMNNKLKDAYIEIASLKKKLENAKRKSK